MRTSTVADRQLDRRVRRTRRRLKEALLTLIDERGYEGITVQDIADRADVGRSTFYSHFASKEDLLFRGFDEWLLSLAEATPAGRDRPRRRDEKTNQPPGEQDGKGERDAVAGYRFSLPLLEHIRGQRRFFQATIVGGADSRVRRKTAALLTNVVRRELDRAADAAKPSVDDDRRADTGIPRARIDADQLTLDARAHAVVGAFLELAAWWLAHGSQLSAEEVDELFQELFAG